MFRDAFAIARQFTLPVVLSRRTIAGKCESSIGTCVLVNDEGWIVTAAHILLMFDQLAQDEQNTRSVEAQRAALESDKTIDRHERRRREKALPRLRQDATDRLSIYFGGAPLGTTLVDARVFSVVDLGIGRLTPFSRQFISRYPIFKDATRNLEPGVSLCKLGFPFHEIEPTWNATTGMFELPPGALPMPLFPMDGIFTRHLVVEMPVGQAPPPFPLQFLETSTPGLRGQSGGPTFDVQGTVWAIQSSTAHLHLGFSPQVPGGRKNDIEHQFLNVGYGIHPATLLGAFNHLGIRHQVSAY
jgi:hypothetical protein